MRPFSVVLAACAVCHSVQARPIRTLDMDALVFSSDAVVEGEIESTQNSQYEMTAQVKVDKSLSGTNFVGQTLSLRDGGRYRNYPVGSKQIREGVDSKGRAFPLMSPRPDNEPPPGPLATGDRAIFFLNRDRIPLSVKVVLRREVADIGHEANLQGIELLPTASRATFEAELRNSQNRIADFKEHLAKPDASSANYWLNWVKNRTSAQLRWYGTDAIRRAALDALVVAQSWPQLAVVLELPKDSDHSMVVEAFNQPDGRNYLLKRLETPGETRVQRLQWARVLQENVGLQSKVFGGETENVDDLLRRTSHLALENRADVGLSLEFVKIVSRFLERATGNGWNVPKTLRVGLEPKLRDLKLLRVQTDSLALKKQIDASFALARRSH